MSISSTITIYKHARFEKQAFYKYLQGELNVPSNFAIVQFIEDHTDSTKLSLFVKDLSTDLDYRTYTFLRADLYSALRIKFSIPVTYEIDNFYDDPLDSTFMIVRAKKL